LTDAEIVTLDDLLGFENSLTQISSSHNIDVSTKITLATNAISDKVMLWLLKVRASDPQWLNRRLLGVSTIVVTPTLHRWLCFDSLARFFEEAYNVQLNTRFQGKWTEYQQQASDAADMVFMTGIGIVYKPLPKPQMPVVSLENRGTSAGVVFVQSAWVGHRGDEGALSPINAVILDGGSTLTVSMAEPAIQVPAQAAGWNVYASTAPDDLTRQNNVPLPIGSMWQLPVGGVTVGPQPTDGQSPDFFIELSKQLQRG